MIGTNDTCSWRSPEGGERFGNLVYCVDGQTDSDERFKGIDGCKRATSDESV